MAWKTLCNEVELLTLHPMIGLAIADSHSPVPGYLYGEINAITYIESGKNCKPLTNFLVSRLQAKTPFVSVKVLKLLLHLAKNGHAGMIEEIKFHEVALKSAMGFYGTEDEFHGKTYFENIRNMSQELLEYAFSDEKRINDNQPYEPELVGYGSSASTKKMSGFGHSVKNEKSMSSKVGDTISSFVERMLPSTEHETSEEVSHIGDALPRYKPIAINKKEDSADDLVSVQVAETEKIKKINVSQQLKKTTFRPGRPGGGWDDSDEESTYEEQETPTADETPEDVRKDSSVSFESLDFSKMDVKEANSDWIDELELVQEFTKDEPLHQLDSSNISVLCKKCTSLNCDKILIFLVEKFSEKEENVILRALILTEYLLYHDVATLESLLKFVLPPVSSLAENKEATSAVKLKAKKMSLIIGNLSKMHEKQSLENS